MTAMSGRIRRRAELARAVVGPQLPIRPQRDLIRIASSSSHLPHRLTDDRTSQKPQPEVAPDQPCAAILTRRKDLELPQSIRPSHVLAGDVEQVSGLRDRDRRAARARATTTARISDVEKSIPRRRPSWTAPGAVQYPVPDLESLLSQDRVIEQMQISPYPFRGLSALVDLGLQEGQYIDADRLPARHDRPPDHRHPDSMTTWSISFDLPLQIRRNLP